MDEEVFSQTRLGRARLIRHQILDLAAEHGRWEEIPLANGRSAKIWIVDADRGWEA